MGVMKKWTVIFLFLFLAGVTFSNPVIVDPVTDISYAVVVGSAAAVEAAIVALLLFFFSLSPLPVFAALFGGNLVIYFVLFLPLLDSVPSLWIAEIVIVVMDGLLIKIVSLFESFQLETFKRLRWRVAFLFAAIGNVVSYYVGVVVNG